MKCPHCGCHTRVSHTEHRPEGTLRRRQCLSARCAHRFETLERTAKMVRGYTWPGG